MEQSKISLLEGEIELLYISEVVISLALKFVIANIKYIVSTQLTKMNYSN